MKKYPHPPATSRHGTGFVLIEVLSALLIFAIGILGLVGLQATAIKQSSAAQYRAIAALQANELISRMWLNNRTANTLQAYFGSAASGDGYASWLTSVKSSGLPQVASKPPTVTFSTVAGGGASATSSSLATITIYWQAPGEDTPHQYVAMAQVK